MIPEVKNKGKRSKWNSPDATKTESVERETGNEPEAVSATSVST
ncbi:MAG: hypothetical protein WC581_09495 [Thermodesulfovibrionales bacterium]